MLKIEISLEGQKGLFWFGADDGLDLVHQKSLFSWPCCSLCSTTASQCF